MAFTSKKQYAILKSYGKKGEEILSRLDKMTDKELYNAIGELTKNDIKDTLVDSLGSSYLMDDGSVINNTNNFKNHEHILNKFGERFINENKGIPVNSGIYGTNFAKIDLTSVNPNGVQLEKLKEWLESIDYDSRIFVIDKEKHIKDFNFKDNDVNDIIRAIKENRK